MADYPVAPEAGPVLQSVLLAGGRREAIISGVRVSEGEKFGDARVIKISENGVVLKSAEGLQTLKLFPAVEKKTAKKEAPISKNSNRRHSRAGGNPALEKK